QFHECGVETRALKQGVRRNLNRFPADFMFELIDDEVSVMVSQTVIPGIGKLGGAAPMAFYRTADALALAIRFAEAVEAALGLVQRNPETGRRRFGTYPDWLALAVV